jgi:hypothetical protein
VQALRLEYYEFSKVSAAASHSAISAGGDAEE